jgi:hypothetical protein
MSDDVAKVQQLIELKPFPTQKPHISFSEVKEWTECSWRHKLRQVDKIEVNRPSIHARFGSAVHAFCEDFLWTRVPNHDKYHAEFEKAWQGTIDETQQVIDKLSVKDTRNPIEEKALEQLTKSLKDLNKSKEKDTWREQGVSIVKEVPTWLEANFPEWEFIDAEHNLNEVMEKHQLKFKGFIDCVIKAAGPRGKPLVWVLDWKTCAWGWPAEKKSDPMIRSQLVYYKHFFANKAGVEFKDVRCGFVLLKRTAQDGSRCELVPVSVGDVTLQRSLKVLDNMITSVRRGIAIKNKDSCQYCDYKGTEWCP